MSDKALKLKSEGRFGQPLRLHVNMPALIPTNILERMIISKDLAALLVRPKRELSIRKILFSNIVFFLQDNKQNDKVMTKKGFN